jgi:hypothetical protein
MYLYMCIYTYIYIYIYIETRPARPPKMEDGRPLKTIKLSFCKYLTVVDFDNAPPRIFLGRGGAFPAAAISARVNLLLVQQQGGWG